MLVVAGTQQSDEDREEAYEKILESTEMASNLTRELLTFGRRDVRGRRVTVLDEEVQRIRELLERILPADIKIELDLGADEASVELRSVHAEQILLNLALNAKDAMRFGGGTLTLRTAVVEPPVDIRWPGNLRGPDRCVHLEIRDTGSGMPPGVVSRIFEPYYTTKELGSGLGAERCGRA